MRLRLRKNWSHKKRSKKSEQDLAALVKGRVQIASGALPVAGLKGDVVTKDFMFDDKITRSNSFSVNMKLWKKLKLQALHQGRKPILRVSFIDGENLYVMDELTFVTLCQQESNE